MKASKVAGFNCKWLLVAEVGPLCCALSGSRGSSECLRL